MDTSMVILVALVVIIAIGLCFCLSNKKKENLSLSQFPIPTCSTCKSCQFYTCGKCGTVYQEQNKEDQICNCGGFTVYRNKEYPSCYCNYLKIPQAKCPVSSGWDQTGRASVPRAPKMPLPWKSEGLVVAPGGPPFKESPNASEESLTVPTITPSGKLDNLYVCQNNTGMVGLGTFTDDVPCPVPFPKVTKDYKPYAQKQLMHTSELDIKKALDNGQLIIIANNGKTVEYLFDLLVYQTRVGNSQGYADLYYVDGPVVVMKKEGPNYHYIIDYPIKYTAENMPNYVNKTSNWLIAKTAYHMGTVLINQDAPVIFYTTDRKQPVALNAAAQCQPYSYPQSSTDYFYKVGDKGCADRGCLWGPPYGSGNWLTRV